MVTTSGELRMHVFGSSQGECIVLQLPTGEVGVIDCYEPARIANDDGQICQFLRDNNVERIEFLCMTHPHRDHYLGMSRLLKAFDVRYFWRPAVMSGKRLKQIIACQKLAALESGNTDELDEADELLEVFHLIKKRRKANNSPLIPKNVTTGTQVYPVPVDPKAHFQIWAIGPSSGQTERYEEGLSKCFNRNGSLKTRVAESHHNMISMALLVMFGDTHIVLGGDVESEGWEDILAEFSPDLLSATAVKISHHGSTNGYCSGLWEKFARNSLPAAVVTPYLRFRLPERAALRHIEPYVDYIATPCIKAVSRREQRIPFNLSAPPASRVALKKALRACSEVDDYPLGVCRFTFDAYGRIIDTSMPSPCGRLNSDEHGSEERQIQSDMQANTLAQRDD